MEHNGEDREARLRNTFRQFTSRSSISGRAKSLMEHHIQALTNYLAPFIADECQRDRDEDPVYEYNSNCDFIP